MDVGSAVLVDSSLEVGSAEDVGSTVLSVLVDSTLDVGS